MHKYLLAFRNVFHVETMAGMKFEDITNIIDSTDRVLSFVALAWKKIDCCFGLTIVIDNNGRPVNEG